MEDVTRENKNQKVLCPKCGFRVARMRLVREPLTGLMVCPPCVDLPKSYELEGTGAGR